VVKSTRVFILTLLAMIAFASNSLLCRAALKQTTVDAATFTFVRIFSGAAALWLIMEFRRMLMVRRAASPLVERYLGSSVGELATGFRRSRFLHTPLPFHLRMSIFQLERARCFCSAQCRPR